jgi:hypothetical protein
MGNKSLDRDVPIRCTLLTLELEEHLISNIITSAEFILRNIRGIACNAASAYK